MSRDTSIERTLKPAVQEIDRALRRLAVMHAALDADEAHWLRIAEEQNVWPKLGYVHGLEYLEEVFGYAPRTALERLRVARELGDLPQLEDALRCGELSHSVVRELTRVATSATIDRWIEAARGRRLRDVEQMVSGRKKGDDPDAKPDPSRVKHRVVLELDGESLAIWRQMQQVAELEVGHKLDDRSFVLSLRDRALHHSQTPAKASSNPQYMTHIMTCRDCRRVWMDGAGVRVEVSQSVLERAQCDSIIVDDEQRKRATRSIPPRTRRLVLERAEHRCQVPGCRSSKHLTIHHIVFRSNGGDNDPSNLVVLCDGHHRLLHDGLLRISGRAPDELVFQRNGLRLLAVGEVAELSGGDMRRRVGSEAHAVRKHASAPSKKRADAAMLQDEDPVSLAQMALRQLGFKAAVAARAVDAARAHVGADTDLGALIKEALRHCR